MSKTVELARHLETLHINNMYKNDFYWTWDKTDEEIDAIFTVADALRGILERPLLAGTFHLTCEGEASWYEFACKIFEIAGNPQKVIPCTSDEYKTPARRPANSCLEKKMLRLCGLPPMPHWENALKELMRSNL